MSPQDIQILRSYLTDAVAKLSIREVDERSRIGIDTDLVATVAIAVIADRLCHIASAVTSKGLLDVNCWDPNAI